MRQHSVHHESCEVSTISFREPVCRDRRENRFGHQACAQDGKLTEKRNRRILRSAQMFSSPEAYPSHQSKGEDGVTQDAFGRADFRGIQSQPGFDVGEKLFDGPAPGKAMNQQGGFEIQVGRGQVSRFAFALAVPDDDDLKLDSGLGPPSHKRFVVETDELAINFDSNFFPTPTGLSDRWKAGEPASIFGLAAPLFGFPFGKRGSEDGIETQTAGQSNFHGSQRFENRLIVVGPVGYKRNLEGNPALDFLKCRNRDLEPGTKLFFGAMFFGTVKRNPKRQSDRDSEQLGDYGQDHPVVSPNVTGSWSFDVIPKGAGAEDVFAPLGTQRIVDGDQKFFQWKRLKDQGQQDFGKYFGTEFEMREEAVKTGFVAIQTCPCAQASDVPLPGSQEPRNGGRAKVGPAPFGKGQTKIEDYFRKLRCRMVVHHGPFSGCCELSSQQIASENGLFFLNAVSSN